MKYQLHVLSNRAERLWQTAADNACLSLQGNTLVSYLDPFRTTSLKDMVLPKVSAHIQVLARKILNPLSDKRVFPTLLQQNNCSHLSPRTFESIEEAIIFSKGKNRLWFLKNIFGTAGEGMEFVKTIDLVKIRFEKHYVIQEGVDDLELFEGKKFVTRVYLLCRSKKLYISQRAFCVVHGTDYDLNNTDYDMQINHAGYAAAGSPIALKPLDKIEYHRLVLSQSIKLFSYLIPAISKVHYETNKFRYAIFGADILLKKNGELSLIEINTFPIFTHTDPIISEINVPFLTSGLEHMTGMGNNKKELIELGQSA